MEFSQRHAIITRTIRIIGILLLLPCAVMGVAIDVAADVYGDDQGVEVVKGWNQCGGYEYSGPTQCEDGFQCRQQHETYYQCTPVTKTKLTPTANIADPTRPPDASPEPTTPSLPPRTTIRVDVKDT
ncbi:hypothetical protein AGABI1DRAFT_113025 [Agaricus bisporus var. burnettii JB137-S8]|uniref:CBM1 domain-containing protein n=1 Tax=Agaricus bisporus var. burnettii (strain JB137-S8 / ATCC MYA-4627 / FGSC 10392) TaxID=597362 RepID=K5XDF8_AGABU|nr:uncharacterized protein AGABI1DRAFT_113025 [Agaricus bisporus var. burnettii JB137-S8]EKM81378.1 hypothetical protein AGABI1DRAFT_113025 [Agaricus bisporus var. burnettii JB137-S8]